MMFALCAATTFRRPCATAYSKAWRTIRSEPNALIGLIEIPASSRTTEPSSASVARSCALASLPRSNSMPAYRSSVFSRTMTTSVSGKRVRTPSKALHGRTQA